MATLSVPHLRKRNNWQIFLDKIKNKEPFESKTGKVLLHTSLLLCESLDDLSVKYSIGRSIFLPMLYGDHIRLSDLIKTTEFGSNGRTGTEKEDIALADFNSQIKKILSENNITELPLYVGNRVVNITEIVSTPGTPKSDFHAVNKNGHECAWFSHKDGSTPKDFQQWGGMTESQLKETDAVKSFVDAVHQETGGVIPRRTTLARSITDDNVIKMSIYGVDYITKTRGRQNVDVIIQGQIKLVDHGGVYYIESNHVHYNGDNLTDGFEPVMMAIYKGDRSNFGVEGARFAIQPRDSRKVTKWL
jgi:hypothetical protein